MLIEPDIKQKKNSWLNNSLINNIILLSYTFIPTKHTGEEDETVS